MKFDSEWEEINTLTFFKQTFKKMLFIIGDQDRFCNIAQ